MGAGHPRAVVRAQKGPVQRFKPLSSVSLFFLPLAFGL